MRMWIARDRDGELCLFQGKPYRDDFKWESHTDGMRLEDYGNSKITHKFEHITWESKPIMYELKEVVK